jgi:hypothetical protein
MRALSEHHHLTSRWDFQVAAGTMILVLPDHDDIAPANRGDLDLPSYSCTDPALGTAHMLGPILPGDL